MGYYERGRGYWYPVLRQKTLPEALGKTRRRAAAGYLEGFQAAVTAVKANEAILTGKRIELKPEWYELK
jgi:hypothetical protein